MFNNLTQWHYPETVDEALSLLKKNEVIPHAGGTGLLRVKSNRLHALVDLKHLSLASLHDDDKYFYIGAGTALSSIASWEKLTGAASILKEAASLAACNSLRNRITIGGSIAQLLPWSDFPPVLLVLDAQIIVKGSAGGTYSAEQFLNNNPLDGASLITEIKIPKLPGKTVFERITQTKFDYSMLDLAIYVSIENEKVNNIYISIGCIVSRAIRLYEVEKFIRNKKLSEIDIEKVLPIINITPIEDKRASKEYRKDLLNILIKKNINELLF